MEELILLKLSQVKSYILTHILFERELKKKQRNCLWQGGGYPSVAVMQYDPSLAPLPSLPTTSHSNSPLTRLLNLGMARASSRRRSDGNGADNATGRSRASHEAVSMFSGKEVSLTFEADDRQSPKSIQLYLFPPKRL